MKFCKKKTSIIKTFKFFYDSPVNPIQLFSLQSFPFVSFFRTMISINIAEIV